jgi:hypothetical protein
MLNASYVVDEPNVVSEAFDGQFVILNIASGTYYSLQGSRNDLWAALIVGVPPTAVLKAMRAAGNQHSEAARAFFESVVKLGLVRPAALSKPTELTAADASKLAAIDAVPAVEAFDDLADLIKADPVHEVDEQIGWPASKSGAV